MFQTRLFWLSVIYVVEVEKIDDKLKCRGQSLDPSIYPTHINVTIFVCIHFTWKLKTRKSLIKMLFRTNRVSGGFESEGLWVQRDLLRPLPAGRDWKESWSWASLHPAGEQSTHVIFLPPIFLQIVNFPHPFLSNFLWLVESRSGHSILLVLGSLSLKKCYQGV